MTTTLFQPLVQPFMATGGLVLTAAQLSVLEQLRNNLNTMGWTASIEGPDLVVLQGMTERLREALPFFQSCDFSGVTPGQLRTDIEAITQILGVCP